MFAASGRRLYCQRIQELYLLPSRTHTIFLSFSDQEPFIQTTTMQLISHAVYAVTVLATIVAAVPGPIVARGEKYPFSMVLNPSWLKPNPPWRPATF